MLTQTFSLSAEIDAHMARSRIRKDRWYVGVTSDIEERLFGYHRVPREGHWRIHRRCANASEARALEAAYHRAGCQGAGGGGDKNSVYVYAYVITTTTVE